MQQEIPQEENRNDPLSTAALAHVQDRNNAEDRNKAEDRAQQRAEQRADERTSGTAANDPERPRANARPTLVQPGTRRDPSRTDGAANAQPVPTGKAPDEEQATPLFSEQESKDLFAKWDALQVGFIDEPRHAVEQADNLVATAMKRTAEMFAQERARLEQQWGRGDNVSTEDLRVAMRRYRSFFRRLLTF